MGTLMLFVLVPIFRSQQKKANFPILSCALAMVSDAASLSASFSCSPASGASSAPFSLSFGASSENRSLDVHISPPERADFAFFTA